MIRVWLGSPVNRVWATLAVNLVCAVYHGALGLLGPSWWFVALSGYYTVMAMNRFAALLCVRREAAADVPRFVRRGTGALLILLSCVLAGVNYMSLTHDVAARYGTIVMITIAAFTFGKITMAIFRGVRQRGDQSPVLAVVRRIGYAEAAVSLLTLQRSMLASFEGMSGAEIFLMNAMTGAGVFLFILAMGIKMIIRRTP